MKRKIKLIQEVKNFAFEELGITPNKSFERVVEGQKTYLVYASEPDSIETVFENNIDNWSFESEEDCDNLILELKCEGIHTLKLVSNMYGGEEYQIEKSTLKDSTIEIISNVLHENFHTHCEKKKIKLEPEIEESVATYFGHSGLILFLKNTRRDKLVKEAEDWFKDCLKAQDFINKYAEKLNSAYNKKDIANAKKVMTQVKRIITRHYDFFIRPGEEVNNAFFVRQLTYSKHIREIMSLLERIHPKKYTTKKYLYDLSDKILEHR